MSKLITVFFLTIVLVSCGAGELKEVVEIQVMGNENFDNKEVVELSEKLDGLWVADSYLKNIETNKSVYQSKQYDTKILGFSLSKETLLTENATLEGFTDHEGGYNSPIRYDNQKGKFVNDIAQLSGFSAFPDPFELNYNGGNILEMYFPLTKTSDNYRKIDNLQTELRKLLIAGKYTSNFNHPEIQFDNDGKIYNFQDFKYYELVADFGSGIEYDALVFFKTLNGGNWSEGEIYKFEISANKLNLQHVKTNWETMEHEISDEIFVLVRG